MIAALLLPEIQAFIRTERTLAERKALAFQKNPFPAVPWQLVLEQIESREKCREKLPLWADTPNIIYPPALSVEQTSSESLARYKASLTNSSSLFDATGGFGVDAYYFSLHNKEVTYCEQNADLAAIAQHNFKVLGSANMCAVSQNSETYLQETSENYNWIYLDPARRHDQKGKVFRLEDCSPNVTEHLPLYFSKAANVLLKTAPFLDIQQGLLTLKQVREIHIVAYQGEVKELLWWLDGNYHDNPIFRAVELHPKNAFSETFTWNPETASIPTSEPLAYLYEPHPSLMKGAAFIHLSEKYGVCQIHRHTHVFTHNERIDFPGKCYKIAQTIPYKKKELNATIYGKAAHVVTRNFPEMVAQLRKKWHITESETNSLFFVKDKNDQLCVVRAQKV
ncbi:MAG: SAM-dependent methyltransferase [Flavobacterium sp. BFFFF2]|nr:MAG: SAM-dependent methyltransferase [Flavobacterium sp. BFFFF2]